MKTAEIIAMLIDRIEDNAEEKGVVPFLRNENRNLKDEVETLRAKLSLAERIPTVQYIPAHSVQNLLRACSRGEKINAIKIVRELTGLGLKESKDLVEADILPYRPTA